MTRLMTVAQSLRHARHDFLNDLQLIKMNLDLGRVQEVQAIIHSHAQAAVQLNRLASLRMAKMEEWILLANWRYPEFRFELECVAEKAPADADAAFAEWLDCFALSAKKQLDPYIAYTTSIRLEEAEAAFIMKLEMNGNWHQFNMPEIPGLLATKECTENRLEYTVSVQMEG